MQKGIENTLSIEFAHQSHAKLLHRIFNGQAMRRYSPVPDLSIEELSGRLASAGQDFDTKAPFYRFFIIVNAEYIGTFVVKSIESDTLRAEIGFGLCDEFQGRGLAGKVVNACIDKVFTQSALQTLWGTVSHDNIACLKVMEKAGFVKKGNYQKRFMIQGRSVLQYKYELTKKQWSDINAA